MTRNRRIRYAVGAITIGLLWPGLATGQQIALTGATIIDGLGGEPVSGAIVLIEGDRISGITRDPPPAGFETVDLTGKSCSPGSWTRTSMLPSRDGKAGKSAERLS